MKMYSGGFSLLALAVCCSPAIGQSTPPRNDIVEDRLSPGNDEGVQGGAGFENDGREGRVQQRIDADGERRVRDVETEREERLNRGDRDERVNRNERADRNQRADRENWNDERRDAARQGNDSRIQMFYTKKLENMNNSVVQLSRFAEQRSDSRDVQEFARKLAQGHSEMNARLEKLNAGGAYADRDSRDNNEAQRRSAAYRGNRNADREADRDEARNKVHTAAGDRQQKADDRDRHETSDQNRDRDQKRNDALAEVDKRAYQNRNPNARDAERNWNDRNQAKHGEHAKHGEQARAMAGHHGQQAAALKEICKIEKEAAQNYLDRTQQMLERYKGQDFDMAFLGFQIGSHTWALSELNAMQGVGDEEFQKVVADAKQKMEQHLKQAKQLSKKYEDKEGSNRDRNRDRG